MTKSDISTVYNNFHSIKTHEISAERYAHMITTFDFKPPSHSLCKHTTTIDLLSASSTTKNYESLPQVQTIPLDSLLFLPKQAFQ